MGEKKSKFEILKKKGTWFTLIIGLVLGLLIMFLLNLFVFDGISDKTIAKFKDGKITKNEIYKEMEKSYPVTYLLELIDKEILEKKYTLTDEQIEEIKEQGDLILNSYILWIF